MGTRNYCYDNRCIVVDNDRLETNDHPETDERNVGDRNFPSYELTETQYRWRFFKVVMTYGYYENACIDYIKVEEPDDCLMQLLKWYYNPATKKELFDLARKYGYKLTDSLGYKICRYATTVEASAELIDRYFRDKEEDEINAYLDELTEEWGFVEYYQRQCFYEEMLQAE